MQLAVNALRAWGVLGISLVAIWLRPILMAKSSIEEWRLASALLFVPAFVEIYVHLHRLTRRRFNRLKIFLPTFILCLLMGTAGELSELAYHSIKGQIGREHLYSFLTMILIISFVLIAKFIGASQEKN
ncbi:MAG: hypothetical protein EOO39_08370 [Cytophagaceae bacterium]|nr:MAG: hypothetical protein EOO39_08370 [Cytophagaceae bacterium]